MVFVVAAGTRRRPDGLPRAISLAWAIGSSLLAIWMLREVLRGREINDGLTDAVMVVLMSASVATLVRARRARRAGDEP